MTDSERRFRVHVQAGTLVRIDTDGAHVTSPAIRVDGYCTTTAALIPITIIVEQNGYGTPMSNDPNQSNSGTRQPEPGTATRQPGQRQGQRQGNQPDESPDVNVDNPEGDVNIDQR